MCGRIGDKGHPDHFRERWGHERPSAASVGRQIAPTMPIAVIGRGEVGVARWGLLPPWTGHLASAKKRSMINARCETCTTNAMFRDAMATDRVLVPATHWFEWSGEDKIPHVIRGHDQDYLGLAAIRSLWRDGQSGEVIPTVAIVTRPALGWMAQLHHRMPMVLDDAMATRWLGDGATAQEVMASLGDSNVATLTAFPVSAAVNKATNDQPDLLTPVGAPLA